MIQITPQMRVLVTVEAADFRCGNDGLGPMAANERDSNPPPVSLPTLV